MTQTFKSIGKTFSGKRTWYKFFFAYFTLLFFSIGGNYPVYFLETQEYFNESAANTRLLRYCTVGLSSVFAPLIAFLGKNYKPIRLLLAGTTITALALAISAFIPHYWIFFLFFSVFVSFGVALERMAILQLVKPYFDEYMDFAMATVVSATSFSLILYRPLMLHLIETYTWKPSIFLLGAIHCNLYAGCAVFWYPRQVIDKKMTVVNFLAPHPSNASLENRRRRSVFSDYTPQTFVEAVEVEVKDGTYKKPLEVKSLKDPEPGLLQDIEDTVDDYILRENFQNGHLAVPVMITYIDQQNENKVSNTETPPVDQRRMSVIGQKIRRNSTAIDMISMMSINVLELSERKSFIRQSISAADEDLQKIKDRFSNSGYKICDRTLTAVVDYRRKKSVSSDSNSSSYNKFRRPSQFQGSIRGKRIETIPEEEDDENCPINFNVRKTTDIIEELEPIAEPPKRSRGRSTSVISLASDPMGRKKSVADAFVMMIAEEDPSDDDDSSIRDVPILKLYYSIKSKYRLIVFTIALTSYWISQSLSMMNVRDYGLPYGILDDHAVFYVTQISLFAVQLFGFFIVDAIVDFGATTVYAVVALIMSAFSFLMHYHPDIMTYTIVYLYAAMQGIFVNGSCILESQIINEISKSSQDTKFTPYIIMFKGLGIIFGSLIPENLNIQDYAVFIFRVIASCQIITFFLMIPAAIGFHFGPRTLERFCQKVGESFKYLKQKNKEFESPTVFDNPTFAGEINEEFEFGQKKPITKL